MNRGVLTDYHVHLRRDELEHTAAEHFTAANVERYREAAATAGIAELGVSEHVYRFQQSLATGITPTGASRRSTTSTPTAPLFATEPIYASVWRSTSYRVARIAPRT